MLKRRVPAGLVAGVLIVALCLVPGSSISTDARGARAGSQLLQLIIADDAGAPLLGARIRVRSESRSWWTQSALDGAALLALPNKLRDVELEVTHEDFSDFRTSIDLQEHSEPLRITLERQSQLKGLVVGPQGAPVDRVEVTLVGSGVWPAKHVFTNQRGEFEFYNLRAGIYEISARKSELIATPVLGIQAQPGVSHRVTLQLSVGERLSGQILDARTLQPLPNAQVWVQRRATSIESMQLNLDEKARFEIFVGDDDVPVLYIEAAGYLPLGPYFWPNNTSDTRIGLIRGKTLRGRVIDQDSKPISGVSVSVEFNQGQGPLSTAPRDSRIATQAPTIPTTSGVVPKVNTKPATPLSTVQATRSQKILTDIRGEFVMESLPEGTLQLTLEHPDYVTVQSVVTARSDSQTFKLIRGGSVRGRVIDAQRIGVSGVQLEVQSENAPSLWIQSDQNGEFVARQLFGKIIITARPPNGTAQRVEIFITGGQEARAEIQISEGHLSFEGSVISSDQTPIAGATFQLRSLSPTHPGKWTQLSDDKGIFAFRALHEGAYQISVEQNGYLPQQFTVQVPTEKMHLILQRGLRVRGTVLDNYSSQPVTGANICLGAAKDVCARSDRNGEFELARALEGDNEFLVTHERYAPLRDVRTLRATAGASNQSVRLAEPLRLLSAGMIEGDIVDAYAAPLEGATIQLAGADRVQNTTVSDQNGHFVLNKVPSGDQWLSVSHRYAGEVERFGPIRVYSSQTSRGVRIQLPRTANREEDATASDWRFGVPLALARDGEFIVVSELLSDDANVLGDIRVADRILAIDDREVSSLAMAQTALLGPAATEVMIRIQRGNSKDIVITQRIRYDAGKARSP